MRADFVIYRSSFLLCNHSAVGRTEGRRWPIDSARFSSTFPYFLFLIFFSFHTDMKPIQYTHTHTHPSDVHFIYLTNPFAILLIFVFCFSQVLFWMGRPIMWRMWTLPWLHARVLPEILGLPLWWRLGRPLLQPGPKLLHQPSTLPQQWNLLQHRAGFLHVRLSGGIHGHRLRVGSWRLLQ